MQKNEIIIGNSILFPQCGAGARVLLLVVCNEVDPVEYSETFLPAESFLFNELPGGLFRDIGVYIRQIVRNAVQIHSHPTFNVCRVFGADQPGYRTDHPQ